VAAVDVRIRLYEMVADYGSEEFERGDWVLLCEDVAGLLLGVCGYDDAVVCFGVAVLC